MSARRLPVAWLLLAAGCAPALKAPPSVTELAGPAHHRLEEVDALLARAERAYREATLESVRRSVTTWLDAAAADEGRIEGWVGATRSGVWLAGHEPEADERERAATGAVQAAQLCGLRDPRSPICSYWLAVAIGVQARERRATALDALPRMVELLEGVAERNPSLDHAGPERVLALVFLRAPGWPTGPGDPDRGLEHARRAVALEPDFPPNQLCLAEALRATEDPAGSGRAYARAVELAAAWVENGEPGAGEWLQEARDGLASLEGR